MPGRLRLERYQSSRGGDCVLVRAPFYTYPCPASAAHCAPPDQSPTAVVPYCTTPGAGHVYVKIRGGELGDKKAKKGDVFSEALIKEGFGRGNRKTDRFRGRADRTA